MNSYKIKTTKAEAKTSLLGTLVPGDTLFIRVVKHGDTVRYVNVMFSPSRGEYHNLTYAIACIMGEKTIYEVDEVQCIRFSGCGYSPATEIQREVGREIFGDYAALRYTGSW